MERGGNFRGGRGFGRGRGNGRGGRGRGRGRGRGNGRGGRGGELKQQRRHDEQGYASYPPPQHGPPRGYPSRQGYPPHYPPPQDQQYQTPFQAPYQVPPPYEQHGYSNGGSMYPRPPHPHVDRYPNQPSQQYPHYQQGQPTSLPPPYQQSLNEKNPPMPPGPAPPQPVDYAEAVRTRQQAYAPVPRESDPQVLYHEASPPVPEEPRPEWNQVPPVDPVWSHPPVPHQWPHQPSPSPFHGPRPYSHVPSSNGVPVSRAPLAVPQRQDRPPPPTYVCHNCHLPGHWKHHCPSTTPSFRSRPIEQVPLHASHGTTWSPCVPPPIGFKPQDPRKNPGTLYPPLPKAPLEDAEPSRPGLSARQATTSPVYTCAPCQKAFGIVSQYDAHLSFHVTCTKCTFTASKRVVDVHYQTVHGQYAGHGYKEIDVEGQTFRVLVGNAAADIVQWRAERRQKWLAMAKHAPTKGGATARKRKWSPASEALEEGEIDEDEEARARVAEPEKRRAHERKQERRGASTSLLRRLVATDVRREQQQLLEIVHYLVATEGLMPPRTPICAAGTGDDAARDRREGEEGEAEASDAARARGPERLLASPEVHAMALGTLVLEKQECT